MYRFILLLTLILAIRIITFYIFQPQEVVIQTPNKITVFSDIKTHINDTYAQVLPKPQADLLMGIVFGSKDLDSTSREKFISTGVMHVVAASGMNVSMLVSFLLGTLVIFFNRKHALIITAVMLILYTALDDFQPSIVRAAIMGLFALGAGFLGRQNTAFFALFLAAWAMILFDPQIITSISFMLSFSATLGIIILDPILKQFAFRSSLFEDLRTTLSAQIATTPIILFFFGTYSLTSVIVNLLVLWTIPPLMVLGTLSAVLSFASPFLAVPFVYLSIPLLSYFNLIVNLFSSFAQPLEIESIPITIVIGYYLFLFGIILYINKNKNKQIVK